MLLLRFLYWLTTQSVFAQSPIAEYCNALHPGCGAGRLFVVQLANRVIDFISTLIIAFAATELIKAGYQLTISGFNEEYRGKAKTAVFTALVGVFLAIIAKTVVYFLADYITTYVPPLQ